MPERVSLSYFLIILAYYLPPLILIGIVWTILYCVLWRVYRHYSTPSAVRAAEHRRWAIGRLKEWIRARRELVDRGWESLRESLVQDEGMVGEAAEGAVGGGQPRRYREDERLQELEGRLEELMREEGSGLVGDLEEGGRRD